MYKAFLILHVISGMIALITGGFAIFSKKGGKIHTRSGDVYYLAMWSVAITAFIMTIMKFNPFLLSIALFSLYMSFGGKRAINNWRLKQQYYPTLKDKLPNYIALLVGLFMIGFPVATMVQQHTFFVPVLGVFGIIMLFFSIREIRTYSNVENFKPRNRMWLIKHIGQICGSYIAAVTAFLVNNVHINPGWVAWLLPTFVGVPLIIRTSMEWKKKLRIE